MAITLPYPLTVHEIRVLQEFRRVGTETLTVEAARAIKHPAPGGENAFRALVESGYLATDEAGASVSLTEKGRQFLVRDVKPDAEDEGAKASSE